MRREREERQHSVKEAWVLCSEGQRGRNERQQHSVGDGVECALQVRLFRHSGAAAEERRLRQHGREGVSRPRGSIHSCGSRCKGREHRRRKHDDAQGQWRAQPMTAQGAAPSFAAAPGLARLGVVACMQLAAKKHTMARTLSITAAVRRCHHRWLCSAHSAVDQRRAMQKPSSTTATLAQSPQVHHHRQTVRVAMQIRICSCVPSPHETSTGWHEQGF
jgi:hypothetical protein